MSPAPAPTGFREAAARFLSCSATPGTSTILPVRRPPPHAAETALIEAPERTLARLRKALRRERARGRAGHFSYDLARHLALAQQVRSTEAALRGRARPQP